MPHDYRRTDRIADQIQRELAILIQQELKDPRVGMVTITAVEVSKELEYAKIFFTVFGDKDQQQLTAVGLERASVFLRRALSNRLKLRTTPELRFEYDKSIENAQRMSDLIAQALDSDKTPEQE